MCHPTVRSTAVPLEEFGKLVGLFKPGHMGEEARPTIGTRRGQVSVLERECLVRYDETTGSAYNMSGS